jgi:hypothetical protein
MEFNSPEKSWHVIVYEGSESHELTVTAADEMSACQIAIDSAEETWGTAWWRVWSINNKRILPKDENPENAEDLEPGQPWRYRVNDSF